MARKTLMIALTCASLGVLLSYLIGGSLGELVFGVLAMAYAPSLMMLAIADRRRSLAAILPIALLLVLLESCLAGMWIYRGLVESGPWWLGLPAASAIQIYGLLLAAQAVVTLGFALTFRGFDVSDEELDALRRLSPAGDG
jgi:hypothetical protein